MAQSRLEKIGTIFTRVTGLLRSGAMKAEEKPLWYDVYATFPPKLEPRYDRPAPNMTIRKIFYEEDIVRAKHHKNTKQLDAVNLSDVSNQTNTQQLIGIYNNIKKQGAVCEEQIYEAANQLLQEEIKKRANVQSSEVVDSRKDPSDLVSNFAEAKNAASVNIKDIFKE